MFKTCASFRKREPRKFVINIYYNKIYIQDFIENFIELVNFFN